MPSRDRSSSATARRRSRSPPSRPCRRGFAAHGPDPGRCGGGGRRRDGDRRGRVRRRRLPPGRRGRARAHHAARHGRRRHRRQDRREPARGQEPRRRLLAAGGRAVRHRPAGHAAASASGAAGTGELAKYHFLTGDDLRRAAPRRAHRPLRRHQGRRRGRRRARAPAGGRSSTTATRWPTPSRSPGTTTCATARRSASGSSSPPSWPPALERIDAARVAEHRAVVAGYGLATEVPPGLDRDELLALIGRDKKAVDGLTFVLDGPHGVEVVTGVEPRLVEATLREDGACVSTDRPVVLLLHGPNLNLLGQREPEVYGTATLDDHVATAQRHRRAARPRARGPPVQPRGRAGRRHPRGAGSLRGHRHQPGRLHPLRLGLHDALAAFDGPVVELHLSNPNAREPWRHTSVDRPGGHGHHRRLRWRRLPPWPSKPSPDRLERCHDSPGAAADGRGRRASAALAATLARRRLRRAARHQPHEHPLPHRVHRFGRPPARAWPDDLVFVTDGRYGDQAAEQLAAAGVEARIEVGRTLAAQRELLAAAAGSSASGSAWRPPA